MHLEDLKVEAEYLGRALHSDGRVHAPRLREALGAAANVKVPDLRRADARPVPMRDQSAALPVESRRRAKRGDGRVEASIPLPGHKDDILHE